MSRIISSITLTMFLTVGSVARAEDLSATYPDAKNEFLKFISCRAGYVGTRLQEKIPDDLLAKQSTGACGSEERNLSAKIVQAGGDPVGFMAKVDRYVQAKVAQFRQQGAPKHPGSEWALCVTSKLKPPISRAELDHALSSAYSACHIEESRMRAYVEQRAGKAEVARVIALSKDGIKNQVAGLLEK